MSRAGSLTGGLTLIEVACPACAESVTRPYRTIKGFTVVRCARCRFIYTNPQYSPEDLLRGYNDELEDSAKVHGASETLDSYYTDVFTLQQVAYYEGLLKAWESPSRPRRILDVGCGSSHFLAIAKRLGWEVAGTEVGSWAHDAADRKGISNIHIGLLEEAPFPRGSFDVVFSSQVLEHLSQPVETIHLMAEFLRKDGVFYADVPNMRCLSVITGRDSFSNNAPMGHLNFFTPSSLARLVRSAGLDVECIQSYGGLRIDNKHRQPSAELAALSQSPEGTSLPAWENGPKTLVKRIAKYVLYDVFVWGSTLQVFARRRNA